MENKLCDVRMDNYAKIEKGDAIVLTKTIKPNFYKRLTTKNYTPLTGVIGGTLAGYDKDLRPVPTGCNVSLCTQSGTYQIISTGTALSYATQINVDATKFTVLRYVVSVPNAGTYTVSTVVADYGSTDIGTADGNQYTFVLEAPVAGDYEIILDLSQITAIQNAGWTPTNNGFVLYSAILNGLTAGDVVGFSTIDLFGEMKDLKCEIIARATCLSSFTLDAAYEYTETVCSNSKASAITIEGSFTARMLEDNMMLMAPGAEVQYDVDGLTYEVIKDVTLGLINVNGVNYAGVNLADYAGDACSSLEVILSVCEGGQIGRRMDKLCVVDYNQSTIPTDSYIVLGDTNNEDRYGKVIFDVSFVGKKICISYPVEATYTEFSLTNDFSKEMTVRADFSRLLQSGRVEVVTIGNMKLTGFPLSSTNDDNEIEREISFKADVFQGKKLLTVRTFEQV